MTARFLGALQFLTLLPIRGATCPPAQAAIFFPLTGALLGAAATAVLYYLEQPLGRSLAAALTIAFLVTATGGLHEDGLADVADAFRAGRSREKISAILKDSRIGAYGALALIASLLVRWQALARSGPVPLAGLAAALALSRASLVFLAAFTPAAGGGLGTSFANGLSRFTVGAVALQAPLFAALAGWRRGLAMLLVELALVALARAYFVRRLGGVNGDCLGAACQAVETANMVILAWQASS